MTPSILRAPSAAAVEAGLRAADEALGSAHDLIRVAFTAAHAITVREVLDALVGGAPETLPKDERGCTIYPPLVRALALEVNDLLAKGDCPHGPECECVGSIGDGVMWAMLHRASRALLPDAPKGGG